MQASHRLVAAASTSPKPLRKKNQPLRRKLPANWPSNIIYITSNIEHSELAQHHLELPELVPGLSNWVKIKPVYAPHPAFDPSEKGGSYGVFAKCFIPKGTTIGEFVGLKESDGLRNCSRYKIIFDRKTDIDAKKAGNETRFINDYRDTKEGEPNVEFVRRELAQRERKKTVICVVVDTIKDIEKGAELLVDYGPDYWKHLPAAMRPDETNDSEFQLSQSQQCPVIRVSRKLRPFKATNLKQQTTTQTKSAQDITLSDLLRHSILEPRNEIQCIHCHKKATITPNGWISNPAPGGQSPDLSSWISEHNKKCRASQSPSSAWTNITCRNKTMAEWRIIATTGNQPASKKRKADSVIRKAEKKPKVALSSEEEESDDDNSTQPYSHFIDDEARDSISENGLEEEEAESVEAVSDDDEEEESVELASADEEEEEAEEDEATEGNEWDELVLEIEKEGAAKNKQNGENKEEDENEEESKEDERENQEINVQSTPDEEEEEESDEDILERAKGSFIKQERDSGDELEEEEEEEDHSHMSEDRMNTEEEEDSTQLYLGGESKPTSPTSHMIQGYPVISLLGFDDTDKADIIKQIKKTDAEYRPALEYPASTHLLCFRPDWSDLTFQSARHWGVKIVTRHWLLDSVKKGRWLPEGPYSAFGGEEHHSQQQPSQNFQQTPTRTIGARLKLQGEKGKEKEREKEKEKSRENEKGEVLWQYLFTDPRWRKPDPDTLEDFLVMFRHLQDAQNNLFEKFTKYLKDQQLEQQEQKNKKKKKKKETKKAKESEKEEKEAEESEEEEF